MNAPAAIAAAQSAVRIEAAEGIEVEAWKPAAGSATAARATAATIRSRRHRPGQAQARPPWRSSARAEVATPQVAA